MTHTKLIGEPQGRQVGPRSRRARLAFGSLAVVAALASAVLLPGPVALAAPAVNVGTLAVVLDASGSMAGPDPSGGSKIDAARRAISEAVGAIPQGSALGLQVYGGRFDDAGRGCADVRQLVAPGPVDGPQVAAALAGVTPLGYTPLATSLTRAAASITGRPGLHRVLLVSDGEETCGGDPCAVARQLGSGGVDLTVDTVGYTADAATRTQLRCIATATGGSYREAVDAKALRSALTIATTSGLRTYTPTGTPVRGSVDTGGAPQLGPGQFLDTLAVDETSFYRLDLPAGVRPYVATTLVPPPGEYTGYAGERVELNLRTTKGVCKNSATGSVNQARGAFPVTTSLELPTVGSKWPSSIWGCGEPGTYILEVHRAESASDVADVPVEIVVLLEPPVTDAATLPPPSVPLLADPPAPTPTTPRLTDGGADFRTAPVLTPGTYTDQLQFGRPAYYRVRADWGQRVVVRADFARIEPGQYKQGVSNAHLRLYNPARQVLDPNGAATDYDDAVEGTYNAKGGAGLTLAGFTAPITWRNREAVNTSEVSTADLGGEQYLQLDLSKLMTPVTGLTNLNAQVPLQLTVAVLGAPSGNPSYAAMPTLAAGTQAGGSPPPSSSTASARTTAPPPPSTTTTRSEDQSVSSTTQTDQTRSWVRPVAFATAGVIALALATLLVALPWLRSRGRR